MAVDFTPNQNLKYDGFSSLTGYPLSVSFLFKPNATAVAGTMVVIGDPTSDLEVMGMSVQASGGASDRTVSMFTLSQAQQNSFTSTGKYTAGQWHHIGGVWAASNSRLLYLDGVQDGSNTVVVDYPATPTRVSVGVLDRLNPVFYYDGVGAELGIWDATLTDEEFYMHSIGVSPLLIRPQSLVFYDDLIRDPYNDRIGGLQAVEVGSPVVSEHPRVLYPSSSKNTFYSFPAPPPSAIQSELRKFQVDNEVRQFMVDNEPRKFQIDNEVRSFDVN